MELLVASDPLSIRYVPLGTAATSLQCAEREHPAAGVLQPSSQAALVEAAFHASPDNPDKNALETGPVGAERRRPLSVH